MSAYVCLFLCKALPEEFAAKVEELLAQHPQRRKYENIPNDEASQVCVCVWCVLSERECGVCASIVFLPLPLSYISPHFSHFCVLMLWKMLVFDLHNLSHQVLDSLFDICEEYEQ